MKAELLFYLEYRLIKYILHLQTKIVNISQKTSLLNNYYHYEQALRSK